MNFYKLKCILQFYFANRKSLILPKLILVSTLSYSNYFAITDPNIKSNSYIEIYDYEIKEISEASAKYSKRYLFSLDTSVYISDEAGAGKTFCIQSEIKRKHKIINGLMIDDSDLKKNYFDGSTKDLPKDFGHNFLHINLSPKVLANLDLMDDLYKFCCLGYHIYSDGEMICSGNSAAIYFELTTSEDKQFLKEDFPIPLLPKDYYNDEYCHMNSFNNKFDRYNFPISTDNNDIIFIITQKIIKDQRIQGNYRDILVLFNEIFFCGTNEYNFNLLDQRIIHYFQIYLEKMSCHLNYDEILAYKPGEWSRSIIIFLLIVRSYFHVAQLIRYKDDKAANSILIAIPQRLMVSNNSSKLWTIVRISQRASNQKWNLEPLNLQCKNISDNNIVSEFSEYFANDLVFTINDDSEYEQIEYKEILLSLFPAIDINNSALLKNKMKAINGNLILPLLENNRTKYDVDTLRMIKTGKFDSKIEKLLYNFLKDTNDLFQPSITNIIKDIYETCSKDSSDTRSKNVNDIFLFSYSKDLFYKILIILVRININFPVFIEGHSGYGKTAIMNHIFDIISMYKNDSSNLSWSFKTINSSNMMFQNFDDKIQSDIIINGRRNRIFHVDELDKSPSSFSISQKILDQADETSYVCCIDQYNIDASRFPKSVKFSLINIEPREDGQITKEIIANYLIKWKSSFYIKDQKVNGYKFWTKDFIKGKLNQINIISIADLFSISILEAFRSLRAFRENDASLSNRNIIRFMDLFSYFTDQLIKKEDDETNLKKIFGDAFVLSFFMSLIVSLPVSEKIEIKDEAHRMNINERIIKSHIPIEKPEKSEKYFCCSLRYAFSLYLICYIKQINSNEYLEIPENLEDWNKVINAYAWWKCYKYIDTIPEIVATHTLLINLLIISSCYKCSRNCPIIPVMFIGPQGTSKTLSIELFIHYMSKKYGNKFYSSKYIATRYADPESLKIQFDKAAVASKCDSNIMLPLIFISSIDIAD